MALVPADAMDPLYQEWVDNEAHLYETTEYGTERAAFYAGFAAAVNLAEQHRAGYIVLDYQRGAQWYAFADLLRGGGT